MSNVLTPLCLLAFLGAGPLTSIEGVRSLSASEAETRQPVSLEGVLTFTNVAPFGRYGFIQQGSEGIYVVLPDDQPQPEAGRRIRLEAVTTPGEYAPSLLVRRYEDLGPHPAPSAPSYSFEQLMTGQQDSQLITARGTIRQLHGIIGTLSVLSHEGELPQAQREFLALAQKSANHLHGLLNELLDLARAEAGKLTLEPTEVEPRPFSEHTVGQVAVVAEKANLSLRWDVDVLAPEWVQIDPIRVRQVLLNLLTNALKFTDEGGVSVEVRQLEGETLQLAVSDTGIGIEAALQEALLGRFKQADGSMTRKHGGVGLGLSICKELTGLMGGGIRVESAHGRGSTFFATFAPPPAEPPAQAPLSVPTSDAPTKRLRVLVAEDNPVNQKIVQRMLLRMNCVVTLALDGLEAVEKYKATEFDLILMDLHMPGLDGVEAARHILEQSGAEAPPTVALTADAMEDTREECARLGFAGVLTKPMTHLDLQPYLC